MILPHLLAGDVKGKDCGVLIGTSAIKGQCPFIHLVSKHRHIDPISDNPELDCLLYWFSHLSIFNKRIKTGSFHSAYFCYASQEFLKKQGLAT